VATRTSHARPPRPGGVPGAPRRAGDDAVRARLAAAVPVGRPRRRVGDRRGLTIAGAVVLVALVGVPALAVDLLLGAGPGVLFGLAFAGSCALAALTVQPEDLRAVVVMPPLLHLAFALLAGLLDGGAAPGGWAQRQAAQLASALVYQAPVLWAATVAAAAVASWRRRSGSR
jgi:hypothetical protein